MLIVKTQQKPCKQHKYIKKKRGEELEERIKRIESLVEELEEYPNVVVKDMVKQYEKIFLWMKVYVVIVIILIIIITLNIIDISYTNWYAEEILAKILPNI